MNVEQWRQLLQKLIERTSADTHTWEMSGREDQWILSRASGTIVVRTNKADAGPIDSVTRFMRGPLIEVRNAAGDVMYRLDSPPSVIATAPDSAALRSARDMLDQLVTLIELQHERQSSFVDDLIDEI